MTNFQTLTIGTSGASAQPLVGLGDGLTLVRNFDPNNTLYVGKDASIGPGNLNNTGQIPPQSAAVFDGSLGDIYGACASGETCEVGLYPGAINFFALISVIVSTLVIAASAGNGLFVYNGVPGGPSWDVQFSGDGSTSNPQVDTTAVIPATPTDTYACSAWLSTSENSAGGVELIMSFFNSSFGVIDTFVSPEITSASPTLATVTGLAPAGTAWVSVIIQANGTPAASDVFSAAGAVVSTGIQVPTSGFTAWVFENAATGTVIAPWEPSSNINGNLVGSWSPVAGTDQYGNAYPAGLFIAQTLTVGAAGQSQIMLNPNVNQAFDITTAISGILQAAEQFSTTDSNEVVPGVFGTVLLNAGSSTKMTTVIGSPFGNTGAYIGLESENDGGTDTAVITFGTVTTPDNGTTLIFTPIMTLTPYAFLLYGGESGQVVVTETSGSGTITGLPATVKAEAWGAGASLSGTSGGSSALGGCGSGGYSQEPALATAGSVTYLVPASANSLGGAPPDCTIVGSAVTVTAHSGFGGTVSGFGNGAAASGNTIAYAGARGGNPSFSNPGGGGGGAGAAGPGGAGNHGDAGAPSNGGAAGVGASGGGNGGAGGNPSSNGGAGAAPGGGGGGGGTNADGRIGGAGQVRVTYSAGAPTLLCSIASAAGTDQFDNTYPAGAMLPGSVAIQPGTTDTPEAWHYVGGTSSLGTTFGSGWSNVGSPNESLAFKLLTEKNAVWIKGYVNNATASNTASIFTLPTGYRPNSQQFFTMTEDPNSTITLKALLVTTAGVVELAPGLGDAGSGNYLIDCIVSLDI